MSIEIKMSEGRELQLFDLIIEILSYLKENPDREYMILIKYIKKMILRYISSF